MSLTHRHVDDHLHRFPRVSGDEPTIIAVHKRPVRFSPRERG